MEGKGKEMKVFIAVISALIGIIIGVLVVRKYRPAIYAKAVTKTTSWKQSAKAGVVEGNPS